MNKWSLVLLFLCVILVLGCTSNEQNNTQQPTQQPAQQPPATQPPAQPPAQPPSVPRSITNCMSLITTAELTTTCAGTAQSVVWDHNTTENGNYNGVTKVLATSICGEVYKKTDSSKADLGEIEVIVFDNGKQGSKDVCMMSGSETLSSIGEKACVLKGEINTQVGFVKGNYYVYIGPSSTMVTAMACNTNQVIAVADLVDSNVS